MNRDEHFFTGTIFPMLVCRNNFQHIDEFLTLINMDCKIASPSPENIKFYAEYNLNTSVFGSARSYFEEDAKFTLSIDILFLLRCDDGYVKMVAIEAKMFDKPSASSLRKQMEKQQEQLTMVCKDDTQLQMVALIPEQQYVNVQQEFDDRNTDFQVITWKMIYEAYEKLFPDDYFVKELKFAIDRYCELVSCPSGKLTGLCIYRHAQELKGLMIGRHKGLGELQNDIVSGDWKCREYEINHSGEKIGELNWFSVEQFVEKLREHGSIDK